MGLFARHWAKHVRGCTVAEAFLLHCLADRHNDKTERCYPGHRSLCFEMQCSKVYLVQICQSLEAKQFLKRVARSAVPTNGQTTNQYALNLNRWFPFHSAEVEREEKRLLGYFRRAMETPELAQGLEATWIEQPKVGRVRNAFKRAGFTGRPTRARPYGIALWLAIRSEDIAEHLKPKLATIHAAIKEDTQHIYEYEHLNVWLKKPTPADLD